MAGSSIRDLRPDQDVIEVVLNGAADTDPNKAVMLAAFDLQRSTGVWHLLCDFTNAQQRGTVPEVIALADMVAATQPPQWKQAVLPPVDVASVMAIDTWEAAMGNRGVHVKVFRDRDRDAALAWLATG